MNGITIMQGDQYPLQFTLVSENSAAIPADTVGEIEVTVGPLRKTLTAGEIVYDNATGTFSLPLTQEETFSLDARAHKMQVRLRSKNGEVIGEDAGTLTVRAAQSKAVL